MIWRHWRSVTSCLRSLRPSDRKTIEIIVERDASLVLKAPRASTIERAEKFVIAKRPWVYRKLADKDALTGPSIVKQFVEGEGFAYLGRSYRLSLTGLEEFTGVRLERGRFRAQCLRCRSWRRAYAWLVHRSRQPVAPAQTAPLGSSFGRTRGHG